MPTAYKVIPAPDRPLKGKAHKNPQDGFAAAVEQAINAQAAKGWQYLRTDTLPCQVRQGLTGKTTVFRSVLVFERADQADTAQAGTALAGAAQTGAAQDTPAAPPPARAPAPVTPKPITAEPPLTRMPPRRAPETHPAPHLDNRPAPQQADD